MTGAAYANLIATYIARRFGARGVQVYREIRVGKSIIGKNRCIDVFCICEKIKPRVRDRVQVSGQPGHRRRKDPLRARRSRCPSDAGLHRVCGQGVFRRRPAHAAGVASRRLLPSRAPIRRIPTMKPASWIMRSRPTSSGGTSWWDRKNQSLLCRPFPAPALSQSRRLGMNRRVRLQDSESTKAGHHVINSTARPPRSCRRSAPERRLRARA